MTTRGAAKRPATAGRIVVGARACNACSGTPRCAVVTSAAFACWLTTLMSMTVHIFGVRHRRMSVIERARQVQGLSGRRVRRARPSEPRAGTVTPLSVRTLTGGDVGIGRDVRPSYVQVGAGARMYGFTTRGGRGLPSIRALDNMDTPLPSAPVRPLVRPEPSGPALDRDRVHPVVPRDADPELPFSGPERAPEPAATPQRSGSERERGRGLSR